MKRVSMKKINEVLRLHFKLGLSIRQSGKATNTSSGSVSNYCARFKELSINIDEFLDLNELEQERLFYPSVGVIKLFHPKSQDNPKNNLIPPLISYFIPFFYLSHYRFHHSLPNCFGKQPLVFDIQESREIFYGCKTLQLSIVFHRVLIQSLH